MLVPMNTSVSPFGIAARRRTATTASLMAIIAGGALLLPAPSYATTSCPTGSVLVGAGVCEVVFLSTPDEAWTPPAGIESLQALLVGAGGVGNLEYGGGGGDVQLVELAVTGDVTVTVGESMSAGGTYNSGVNDTVVAQGMSMYTAAGGQEAQQFSGGSSGSGISASGNSGAGAGSTSGSQLGGAGLVVNEIDPATFDLFADDDRCFGGGGVGGNAGVAGDGLWVTYNSATCGGGYLAIPEGSIDVNGSQSLLEGGTFDDFAYVAPEANSGGGSAGAWVSGTGWVDALPSAAGQVVLRFAFDGAGEVDDLAATGVDAYAALAVGAGLIGLGAVAATRRRMA